MSQKNIKIFTNEIYSKGPKKNYVTKKSDVYHIDDIWSLDILDLKNYGPENNRGYRYVLVVIASFSKYGWTVPLKNKNGQTIKVSFENIIINSKRKPNLIEPDRGKKFYINISQDFFNEKISIFILEIVHLVLFLQKDSIVLIKIFLKNLFLKRVVVNRLMSYPQKRNNIITEFIPQLN